MKKKWNLIRGFTVIEIVIALSILIILLAVILPSFRGWHQAAMVSEAEWKLGDIKMAVESYRRHHLQNIRPYPVDITVSLQNTVPLLVKEIIKDPFETDASTRPGTFGYEQSADSLNKYYVIWSGGLNLQKQWLWFPNSSSPTEISLVAGSDDLVVSNLPVKKY